MKKQWVPPEIEIIPWPDILRPEKGEEIMTETGEEQ